MTKFETLCKICSRYNYSCKQDGDSVTINKTLFFATLDDALAYMIMLGVDDRA